MGNIEIRAAKPDEWDSAMELAFRVFLKFEAEEYGKKGVEAFAEFVTSDSLRKAFLAGYYLVNVAVYDNKIIGVTSMRNINHISLLFVDPAYHKQGIGTMLIGSLCDHLKKEKFASDITVNSSPYAVEFYHKLGFVDTAEQTMEDNIIFTPMIMKLQG